MTIMNPAPELGPQLKQLRLSGILDSLEARNREAIDTFARCVATREWPGYPAIEHLVPLPTYAAMQYAEEMHLWTSHRPSHP